MKLRLHSAQKLLPILNGAIKGEGGIEETMDYFNSVMDMLRKHFMLPVSRTPAHIKKRVKSLFTQHQLFLYEPNCEDKQESEDEQENKDEQYSDDEEESEDWACRLLLRIKKKVKSFFRWESEDEWETESEDEQDCECRLLLRMPAQIKRKLKKIFRRQREDERGDEWETEEEQNSSDDKQDFPCRRLLLNIKRPVLRMPSQIKKKLKSFFRRESEEERRRHILHEEAERRAYMLYEAESIIRQELRAPSSYLNQYMKQRIEARQRILQLFIQGIRLTSYLKKELLKLKNNAYNQSTNSQNNHPASLRGLERDNITVSDSLQYTLESTINMVVCNDEFNTIMDKLNQQSSKREIVSIVGMGGIGKTTLARRIYGDASFISRFDCQAWVTISQEYNPTQVFQGLLHSLGSGVCDNNGASNYELAEQVYRRLKHQRYLIVVDDIWNTNVWDDLMRCLQDDNNGSRILLTTRLKNVAEYGSNFCHTLPFLDSNESWNLFQSKMCKRITLSPEFEKIGREIVDKCKGLPLAITVVAGLLSNSNQTFFHEWEHIAKCVPALSLDHSNQQGENIIGLSYTFLPHHLKLCFLSFGCFPEDCMVYEDVIVDFWVSEGFLKVLRSESLEDVARKNLQDLVDRNLVLISGDIYQMHDVLRELALREAQKENLLCFKKGGRISLRWKRNNQSLNSSSCSISQPWKSIQSRICSYNSITPTTNTSSLMDARFSWVWNSTPARVHAHFKFLRALRVRDNVDVNIFLEIVDLVHLRWLTFNCPLNTQYLPLFMLRNLQKLEVYGYYSSCKSPLDIWGLPQLRNLSVLANAVIVVPPRSVHHNLESITSLDYRSCTKELFLRIPNLRTLKVTTDHTLKFKAPNLLASLVYLYKLEHLTVEEVLLHREFTTIHSMGMLSLENFWPNLKGLAFYFTNLKWKDIDVVSTLSKLESLELGSGAVKDQKWELKDGGFRRLKFLRIFRIPLRQYWEVTSDHFPVLEKLFLGNIDLKEIPSGFGDITTLKLIELQGCSKSLISSAKRIQKEHQEYGNETFVVDISRSYF